LAQEAGGRACRQRRSTESRTISAERQQRLARHNMRDEGYHQQEGRPPGTCEGERQMVVVKAGTQRAIMPSARAAIRGDAGKKIAAQRGGAVIKQQVLKVFAPSVRSCGMKPPDRHRQTTQRLKNREEAYRNAAPHATTGSAAQRRWQRVRTPEKQTREGVRTLPSFSLPSRQHESSEKPYAQCLILLENREEAPERHIRACHRSIHVMVRGHI